MTPSSISSAVSRVGYLYVVLAAVCWGTAGSAAKFLMNAGVTSFQLVQLRVTVATVVLFLWLFTFQRHLLRISKKDLPYLISLGAFAMAAAQFTYLLAISKIQVAAAILLQYMAPTLIILYSIIFKREKLTPLLLVAVVGATAGCYLLVGGYRLNVLSMNRIGIISGLLAAVFFAWYSLQGEYGMRKYPSLTVLFYALLFATVSWNIFYPPLEAFSREYSPASWGWIFFIGIMGTALPFGLYLKGVSLIRSTRACLTAMLEPIIAGIVSYFFLNEAMEPLQILGGFLVVLSVALPQFRQDTDETTAEYLRMKKAVDRS